MKIKVPYTLNLLFPIIGWAVLCSAFAYILIIAIADFNEPMAKQAFLIFSPIYVVVFCVLSAFRYSGSGLLAGQEVRTINKNVTFKGIVSGLPTEEIRNTFNALVFLSRGTLINVLASGMSVIVLILLTEWINLASNMDLLIIICGGAIALFFSSAFATFFCQQAMFPVIKECRRLLIEREEKTNISQLSGIGTKFYFLFFLPFFTVLMVLIAVFPFNASIALICVVGLSMTFIIDRVLFLYLSNALKELNMFAEELPLGERAVFVTGSLDKEIVGLSQSLNDASEKMHASKKELEDSQQEMGKRVKELEKFFELTVNREIKMVELKKELKKIKGDVQENDA